jgi:2-desacetyl-2-hydroxyethyl bacteriochlorophyllide A dehydrogenase
MKAAIMEGINGKIKSTSLQDPDPADDEVVIRQNLTGICYRDLLTHEGFFPRAKFPIVPGHEVSGVIVKTGKSVRKFKVGDRVASLIYIPCGKCEYCRSGRENLCPNKQTLGETVQGSYADMVKVPERCLVKIPSAVPEELATITACVTGMVYHALSVSGQLLPGENVLVTGAGGGVGVHAVQVAKALGATVFAYTSSKWKAEKLQDIGVDHVLLSEEFDREAKGYPGGGIDLALDTVGLPTFSRSLRSLKFGGRLVVIGNVQPVPVELPLGLIILKGNRIEGSISSTREDMKNVLKLSAKGSIKPVIAEKVDLDHIEDAYSMIKDKKNLGRVLIDLKP